MRWVLLQAQLRVMFAKALDEPTEEIDVLVEELERLRVFTDIHCSQCGEPMNIIGDQVLLAFEDWAHTQCPPAQA